MCNRKLDRCKDNPGNSSTTKLSQHLLSCFSMSIILPYKPPEIVHIIYKGKDCMEKVRDLLEKHTMKIINFEKKKI